MYLGDTFEQKKESYELLTRRAKKTAKVFGWLGGIVGVCLGIGAMFAEDENKFLLILIGLLILCVFPIIYYWTGYFLYYGFVTVKSWFAKLGIGVAGTAIVAGETIAISYLLGGRRSAKRMGIFWLVILLITLGIGFYAGIFNFFKVRKEAKSLGIA